MIKFEGSSVAAPQSGASPQDLKNLSCVVTCLMENALIESAIAQGQVTQAA